MKKGKIFVFVLLFGILIMSANAFALPVGQHVGFYDFEILPGQPDNWSWTHSLTKYNFIPYLDGDEPNLIIDHALLLLSLNFTPCDHVFKAYLKLGDESLGTIYYHFSNNLVKDLLWFTSITNSVISNENGIYELAKIEIDVKKGTLNCIHNSVIVGSAHVGPEPISMALVGAGLAGLPIAVRFRRLLRK
jgi:hypothetical protein